MLSLERMNHILEIDTENFIVAVPRITTRVRIIPTSVEFMDRRSIQAAYDCTNERLP